MTFAKVIIACHAEPKCVCVYFLDTDISNNIHLQFNSLISHYCSTRRPLLWH